jgi:hypothetical protein
MSESWRYRSVLVFAVIGLALIAVGLLFAYLSNPSRFSINVRDDSRIAWRFAAGVLLTSIGLTAFVAAIKQTTVEIARKTRRDINLGISGGVTFQWCAFTENDPVIIMCWLVAATLMIGWACMRYAQARGYSKACAVLGLFSVFGLIALMLLPPRINQSVEADGKTTARDPSRSLNRDDGDVTGVKVKHAGDNPYNAPVIISEVRRCSSTLWSKALAYGLVFLLGCVIVALPIFMLALAVHADETARGEQTMGPGIEMFLGIVAAPIGGVAGCFVFLLLKRRKSNGPVRSKRLSENP